jgi:hypothetical protein
VQLGAEAATGIDRVWPRRWLARVPCDPEQPGRRLPVVSRQIDDPPPGGGEDLGEYVGGVAGRIDRRAG